MTHKVYKNFLYTFWLRKENGLSFFQNELISYLLWTTGIITKTLYLKHLQLHYAYAGRKYKCYLHTNRNQSLKMIGEDHLHIREKGMIQEYSLVEHRTLMFTEIFLFFQKEIYDLECQRPTNIMPVCICLSIPVKAKSMNLAEKRLLNGLFWSLSDTCRLFFLIIIVFDFKDYWFFSYFWHYLEKRNRTVDFKKKPYKFFQYRF